MVSVMNNDFDLERNTDEGVSDSHLNTEIRVSSGIDLGARISEIDEKGVLERPEWEMDEVRVLGGETETDTDTDTGYRLNGDSEKLLGGDDGGEGDEEIEIKGQEMVSRDGEDEGGGVARSLNGIGNVGAHGMKWKDVRKDEGSERDSKDGEFRLENCGYLQASVSKDVSVSDGDDELRGEFVLDSGFEMGDMVWGKVKSHPWWPGHLFNEAFATSSVRRTRRQGNMLVAFFGDSSYGWFDATELVPYDPHYAEKSQQTASKNFARAVEESIDEASRRSALGLSCYCRNPRNFRPVNVPGYVAVDVVDYEPGAIYSLSQIRKARDSFQPINALSFIKQLAVAPMSGESKKLDFIKNKATTLAYRRSIFEEFDETYAQAFSQSAIRSSQLPALPDKVPSRAPLSGPLVMADTPGSRKSSIKASKTKDLSKKDRYLFKRRDEAGDLKKAKTTQGHASSSSSSACDDGTSDTAAAAFVLQKRDLPVSDADLSRAGSTKDALSAGLGVTMPSASQDLGSSDVVTADSGSLVKIPDRHINSPTSIEVGHGHFPARDGMIKKKKKAAKRPAEELSSEKSDRVEKKMKVRKIDGKRSIEHVKKDSVLSAGMPTEIAALSREESLVSQGRLDNEAVNLVPSQVGLALLEEARGIEADLPQLLADLRGLALNPVHGMERNVPAIARQFFLKFRSSVFLKSSSASALAESELREGRDVKSTPASESTEKTSVENSKAASSMKLQKLSARHEDLGKGRKRMPSERQEEKAAKKAKKLTEAKSSSTEKRALQKNSEMLQRAEGKAKAASLQSPLSKPIKSEQRLKKSDRPPMVEEPTYLIMKYQSGSSLPSLVELKARFARFGPLDTSLSRVFYKTNTCRVAFLYKQHAVIAQRYALGSKTNVRTVVKAVAAPESQQPSSGRAEDLQSESAANRDSSTTDSKPVITAATSQQPVQQLKSCLKKPSGGDETGGPNNGGGSARTARVRFNMGEVKGSADNRGGLEGQKMESRNSMLSSYEGSSSSSIAMDVSNNQRLTVSSHPLQTPLLPHPPQFIRPPINHLHDTVELSPRNNMHDNPRVAPPLPSVENQVPPQPTRDISQQMMNLLTRCHDVVTNVKSMLGYVPYHPL